MTRVWDVLSASDDPYLVALLSVAGEAGLASVAVTEGGWGGWRALSVTMADEEFPELAALALDDSLGVVPIEWRHALALGGEEFLASPEVPDAPVPELTLEDYLKRILTRLLRQNKVGAAHTDLGNFFSGVPGQYRGSLKSVLELMVADGYVRLKPTLTGTHISLEPRRLSLIKQFLEEGHLPPGRLAEYLAD